MQLIVRVFHNDALYKQMGAGANGPEGWPIRFLAAHGFACRIEFMAGPLSPEDLVCVPDALVLLLLELPDYATLQRLVALERRLDVLLRENAGLGWTVAPCIAHIEAPALSVPNYEMPAFVADWVWGGIDPIELTHRILGVLRVRKVRTIALQIGDLALLPGARMICFNSSTIRLSPTEFALAELFLGRLASVITLAELAAFFKAAGNSAAPNNIRVTIFQLRLKLDELTGSQLKLCTIYRTGYCLRQAGTGVKESKGDCTDGPSLFHGA